VNLRIKSLLIALLVAADYGSKTFVRANLDPGESLPLVDNLFKVTYLPNYSGFSWFVPPLPVWVQVGFQLCLLFLALAAFPLYLFYTSNRRHSLWTDLAFIFLVASFLGHSINDYLLGFTVDFLRVLNSPTANLADLYAYIGLGALLVEVVQVYSQRKPRWEGMRSFLIHLSTTRKEFIEFTSQIIRNIIR
jgi:signal peptidase II